MDSKPAHAPTVVIENFYPSTIAPGHLLKRIVGEPLDVYADIFKDGHDVISAVLKWRLRAAPAGLSPPCARWTTTAGRASAVSRRRPAGSSSSRPGRIPSAPGRRPSKPSSTPMTRNSRSSRARGASCWLRPRNARAATAPRTPPRNSTNSRTCSAGWKRRDLIDIVLSDDLQQLLDRFPDRSLSTISPPLRVVVERERGRFSAWYEFFPRGAEGRADKHSTFRDCLGRLDDAKAMGFDVIYFPPIHPIGVTGRKGKNNSLTSRAGDVGSPWAIGSHHGGHRAVEPALGTLEDFDWLVREANTRGLEIALDFALNCSPDHPYVTEHPDWFYQRDDGTIRYAENPPKKYQDIYPLNFHCADWKNLWRELIDVVLFWVARGVKIFRVDNPHTKPVAFWETLITQVQVRDPDVIFLAEAFTAPRMMQELGKIGFTQSYTYFTWRESQARADGVLPGADADRHALVLPRQLLAEHAGHPAASPAERRAGHVQDPRGARRHAHAQLGHLLRLRTLRKHPAARPGGIRRLREIRAQVARLEPARQHQGLHHASSTGPATRTGRCSSTTTSTFTERTMKRSSCSAR